MFLYKVLKISILFTYADDGKNKLFNINTAKNGEECET